MSYKIPSSTRIGHVHLKVSDLDRSIAFYCELLGFQIMQRYPGAIFISAGDYHHHIGLNTWHTRNAEPSPVNACGLYHIAILYAERRELAKALKRLMESNHPLSGAADHGVSEALYLDDPDRNGVELYWDKPKSLWPFDEQGNLAMTTNRLDLENLLAELQL